MTSKAYKDLKNELGLDETFTKSIREQSNRYDSVKSNIPDIAGLNFGADILFMPHTKKGVKYLLVITDLASNAFDIEPLKSKDSKSVLQAFRKIQSRKYVNITKKNTTSIRTDAGNEFLGVFDDYLQSKDMNILHSIAIPNRHKQNANAENLNRLLGRLFNGYMNAIEKKTGKPFNDWDNIIDIVRDKVNKIRTRKTKTHKGFIEDTVRNLKDYDFERTDTKKTKKGTGKTLEKDYPEIFDVVLKNPKFKVGDLVYVKLDYPENALGQKQDTTTFREGDYRWSQVPKAIKKVLLYDKGYRYIVNTYENTAFSENELMKSNDDAEKYVINYLDGKKTIKRKIYYLVKWKGYKDKTWEPKTELMKDIADMIEDYEEDIRNGVANRRKTIGKKKNN